MKEKKLLVYNIHTLAPTRLEPHERELIDGLSSSPSVSYKRIINKYYSTLTNQELSLRRLEELLIAYSHYYDIPILGLNVPAALRIVNELLENHNDQDEGFYKFLTNDGRRAFSTLQSELRNAKPNQVSFFLFAMDDLKLLIPNALTANKTSLCKALESSIGYVGKRQSISINLNNRSASAKTEEKIKFYKSKIEAVLKNKKQ